MRKSSRFLRFVAVFVMIVAARLFGESERGYPVISSMLTEQFGSRSMVFCTTQDTSGVLYFGSNGLMTFDGDRWIPHEVPGLLHVYGLAQAEDGHLWAASEGDLGWFSRRQDFTWDYHSLASKLPDGAKVRGQIWQVFADGPDAVFIGSEEVYRWDGKKFEIWHMPGIRRPTAFKIGGTLYIHYREKGLYRVEGGKLKLHLPQTAITSPMGSIILWAAETPEGLLMVKAKGLEYYRNGKLIPFAPEASALIERGVPSCVTRLPDGRLVIGTGRAGLVIVRPDGALDASLTEEAGFPASYVHSVFVDREGNLWATTMSRAIRVNLDPSVRIFDSRAQLSADSYRIITRNNGQLTIGNRVAAFTLDGANNRFDALENSPGSSFQMLSSPRGLIGLGFAGAWIIGPQVTKLTAIGGIETGLVSRTRPGELIFSSAQPTSVFSLAPDGTVQQIATEMRMRATSIAEEVDRIWMGTEAGDIYEVPRDGPGPATPVDAAREYGLPRLEGRTTVRSTPEGVVFVFADNGGWVKHAGTRYFTRIEDFPPRSLAMAADFGSEATSWVLHASTNTTGACVAKIVIENGRVRWMPHTVPEIDSIGTAITLFAEADTNGATTLWIGGTTGVLKHVVEHGAVNPRPKQPILRAFATTDESTRSPLLPELPYSTRSIAFEFAQPEFSRRSSLRLETRIEGVDSDWTAAAPDSRRELTALRDGSYAFGVRAVSETGVASEPTTITFRILPPWWRTAPAFVSAAVLLACGIYTGYRLRVRSLQRRNTELEDKVRERTEELAAASAAKTLFVANMSHDIRNPLNGIVGLAIALEDTRLDNQQRGIVATLRECTLYLSSLVDDVLDFASIEAGKLELRPGPFAPAELLNSVVTTLKSQAAEKDAFITIETDPDVPPVVRGDAGRIQQILVNYVTNALKYAGGHVRIAVALAPQSPGEIEFSVADDGPGITTEEQAKLFTKFTRLDESRRLNIKGNGLGLASCRHLADLMGGSVGVESQPGHGSRFFLRLPLIVSAEPVPVAANDALPNVSVLLVEDTDYNAMAATAVLGRLGLTCDRAANGEEAIRMFSEKRHNIVLLDRNLPDIDGTEVARRLRELETDGLRSVLLAVTAYCTPEDRELCIRAGMDAFLGKPLTPDKVRRAMIELGRKTLAAGSFAVDSPSATVMPPLDTSLLEYLSDGTESGVAAQAERLIAALNVAHVDVVNAAAKGDMPELSAMAHRVLGHARMIGATRLVDVCVRLETAAREKNSTEVADAMPRLAGEVNLLTEALRRRPRAQKA